jgi:hypothetical protein
LRHRALHARKPDSVAYLGVLIAAAILYVPANMLTVMRTDSLFGSEDHTILGGVVELWNDGSWDLAAIVFIASIVVPILKMLVLAVLVITVRRQAHWRRHERACTGCSMRSVIGRCSTSTSSRCWSASCVSRHRRVLPGRHRGVRRGRRADLAVVAEPRSRLIWDTRDADGPDAGDQSGGPGEAAGCRLPPRSADRFAPSLVWSYPWLRRSPRFR